MMMMKPFREFNNNKNGGLSFLFLLLVFQNVIVLEVVGGASASILGDPYQILGVSRGASAKEVRKSYVELIRSKHPDKNRESEPEEAQEQFIKINRAYEVR
jgi:DnaJ-class molecular chaperone